MIEDLLYTHATARMLSALRSERTVLLLSALDGVSLNAAIAVAVEDDEWKVVRGEVVYGLPERLTKPLLRAGDFEDLPQLFKLEPLVPSPAVRASVEATRAAFARITPPALRRSDDRMISTDGSTITVSIRMPGQSASLAASWYDGAAHAPLREIAEAAAPIVGLLWPARTRS